MVKNISVGADHRGYSLKETLKLFLEAKTIRVFDKGTSSSSEPADYPDIGALVALSVSTGETERGILICGTGIGMSIVANKFKGIRASLCYDSNAAALTRKHNDSNILVLNASMEGKTAEEILQTWLEIPFEGGRHQKRIDIIERIEKNNFKDTASS